MEATNRPPPVKKKLDCWRFDYVLGMYRCVNIRRHKTFLLNQADKSG